MPLEMKVDSSNRYRWESPFVTSGLIVFIQIWIMVFIQIQIDPATDHSTHQSKTHPLSALNQAWIQ